MKVGKGGASGSCCRGSVTAYCSGHTATPKAPAVQDYQSPVKWKSKGQAQQHADTWLSPPHHTQTVTPQHSVPGNNWLPGKQQVDVCTCMVLEGKQEAHCWKAHATWRECRCEQSKERAAWGLQMLMLQRPYVRQQGGVVRHQHTCCC
jgi:hypothetical protein